ncbi:methylmalonyl Co-A mutase-associated GTPase MeaB [Geodermatophilus sp. YIM 151500]|uniref:methylmalonyl Co-A mutase-associated GTPase MeaB n=1 Tax=Geodermatophilus sp. YIM 151500 TaxID=2984531 RepID=UPI0021E384A4|nr:methylmalonyl Co-A mutase-associated GTPase MeaB [Geodermatophilus sp. YIM 151500]MCV2488534.1 methylmalonyl Co-A mutase-associated GTPase MeaB [Geodermatophilus sp. YIM 151500]
MSRPIDVPALVAGVLAGDRRQVARAITLVESRRADHRQRAQQLLVELLPHAGKARRVGISGVPGVGKSTFIDQLGVDLTAAGHRVAVLAVDPSSARSGGSILGDKTRMARLAVDRDAFIRPAPTAGTLGGVAQATRESMVVVEAAGYDVVLVETVGVGQSEVAVSEMVDSFLFLTLARTGDQLQGIKRGILEIADVIAVNKADGPGAADARKAARELAGAIRMLRGHTEGGWDVPVLTCAGLSGEGLDRVWTALTEHQERMKASGAFDERRRTQQVRWTWQLVHDGLEHRLRSHPAIRSAAPQLEKAVLAGELTPALAARELLELFLAAPAPPRS